MQNTRIVFHFNKAHLADPTIPMWVLKIKGQSHYVSHVTVEPSCGFSTKETPDNPHTKGAIQLRGSVKIFENEEGQQEALIFNGSESSPKDNIDMQSPASPLT